MAEGASTFKLKKQARQIQRRKAALARSLDLAKRIAESWQDERSGVEILEQMREEESRWPA